MDSLRNALRISADVAFCQEKKIKMSKQTRDTSKTNEKIWLENGNSFHSNGKI